MGGMQDEDGELGRARMMVIQCEFENIALALRGWSALAFFRS